MVSYSGISMVSYSGISMVSYSGISMVSKTVTPRLSSDDLVSGRFSLSSPKWGLTRLIQVFVICLCNVCCSSLLFVLSPIGINGFFLN